MEVARTGRSVPSIAVMLLKVFLILFVFVVSSDEMVERFLQFAASDHPWRNRVVFLFLWITGCGVAMLLAFLRPMWLRVVLALPLSIAAMFSVIYRGTTDTVLNYSEFFAMWSSRGDWMSAVANYGQHALPGLGVGALLFVAIVLPGFAWRDSVLARAGLVLAYFAPLAAVAAMIDLKGGAAALGVPAPTKVLGMFSHVLYSEITNDFDRQRQSLDARPKPSGARPHVVLIVDESVRGDYLSINGQTADTTPFLRQQQDKLFNFGIASSGFDCSHYSNVVLRFGLPAGSMDKAVRTYPSIWAYAKNAGYRTSFVDAQRRHGQLTNFMTINETKLIDNFVQFSRVDAVERADDFVRKDEAAALEVSRLLKEETPQFIYMNKEGAHAPYEGKYPESETKFRPTMKLGQTLGEGVNRDELKNSYRNAVSWSVDHFFSVLLKDAKLANTVILYTSDHGQNLLEKGVVTHCGQSDPTHGVAVVPLFVVTENLALAAGLREAVRINFGKASHFNIYKTVIGWMGYEAKELPFSYDASLTEPLTGERKFYTGNLLSGETKSHVFSP